MAKSEFITTTPATTEMLLRESKGHYFPGTGVTIYKVSETQVELYGGNRNERDEIRLVAARFDRKTVEDMTGLPALATPRQRSFLRDLINRDPATAMNCGAEVTDALTKDEASKMIEYMLNA